MDSESLVPGSVEDWLRYARSDLELARIEKPEGVLLENLDIAEMSSQQRENNTRSGIDGRLYLVCPERPDLQRMAIEIKGGQSVSIRDLWGSAS